jgi:hypothetical protein
LPPLEGWDTGSYLLKHNDIGGVTNQMYLVRWRVRSGSPKPIFSSPPKPTNCTLKRCLSGATLTGVEFREPTINKINTEKGLITRDHLDREVVVESVFHTLVKRRLTAEEQANVLDFSVDRAVEMTGEELLALTRKEIPGKVLTAASWFLKHWDTIISNDEQMNEPLPKADEKGQPDVKSNHNKTDQSYLDLRLEAKLLRFQEDRVNDVVKDDDAAAPVHLWNN